MEVAIKHRNANQKRVMMRDKTNYVFVPHANIALAWVNDLHVNEVLSIKGGCCGGKKPIFFMANESDIRRWTNRGGR